MSTQTDGAVVANDEQTDVVESVETEASHRPSEETNSDSSGSLDFDELLSVPSKSSKDERKGLSRREHRQLLDSNSEEELDEPEENATLAELREQRRMLEEMRQEQSSIRDRDRSERKFKTTLEERGISETDFSAQYKDEFISTRNELLDEGMSFDKAVDFALRTVTPKVRAAESKKREEGRKGATLPVESTGSVDQTVYKASQIYAKDFPMGKFQEIKQLQREGKVKIVMDV
jgi:hypothetical protein